MGNRSAIRGPPSSDPFAKFDTYDPLKNNNAPNAAPLIKPSQPSQNNAYENRLSQEKQQSSFMDKITSNQTQEGPSKIKEPEIKKAVIGGSRPVMRMNVNSGAAAKPTAAPSNKNLVADLDDLEDLA